MTEFLRVSGSRPRNFEGTIMLPPSKTYLHRALFVSSLCTTPSKIENCGGPFSEDVLATIRALRSLGVSIERVKHGPDSKLVVHPGNISSGKIFASESGTTARFAIAFAAISTDGKRSTITGDDSLLNRPMQPLLDALSQIGVNCHSLNSDGKLPVVVESSGIEGGECFVESSVSSQFISALLIACTQARNDTVLKIDVREAVSFPYIEATLSVLKYFGFKAQSNKSGSSHSYRVKANQTRRKGLTFLVPGDMSSAAALIGATLAGRGRIKLKGANPKMPQADSVFLDIARRFGANVSEKDKGRSIDVSGKSIDHIRKRRSLTFDLKDSPDLVPIVAGTAAAIGRDVKMGNVGHLRYKESDRLSTLAGEFEKFGLETVEEKDSLSISTSKFHKNGGTEAPIVLSSQDDHRILMSLAIAGISGKFGEFLISNPSCVKKSYPTFISDLRSLMNNEKVISVVKGRNL